MAPKWLMVLSPVKRPMTCMGYLQTLTRKKIYAAESYEQSELSRVLNFFDLVALGIGSTLGLGAYVVAGAVAKDTSGPAIIFSFFLAAIASVFAGLCYAEFAALVPKSGSVYVFTYVTVGELMAFVVGWSMVIEYVIGAASVARGTSGYLDSLFNDTMKNTMLSTMPMNASFLGEYPDFFSFALIFVITVLVASGVKISAVFNNICTCINLFVLLLVVIAGSTKANTKNWSIPKEEVPPGSGDGGFFPFGVSGIFAGAAKCFFAFVGFDIVVTAGEEVKNPTKYVPWAICVVLAIVFLMYTSISIVITLMLPYFEQSSSAPFPHAFDATGQTEIKWIVTCCAIFALLTSLLGSIFPTPRVLYAMGQDGLVYKYFSFINSRTHTPFIGTLVSGLLAAFMAMLLDIDHLIDMASIGTLLAYSLVSVCVLLLRYEKEDMEDEPEISGRCAQFTNRVFNIPRKSEPTNQSSTFSKTIVSLFVLSQIFLCGFISLSYDGIMSLNMSTFIPFVFFLFLTLFCLVVLQLQPSSFLRNTFKVPLVPWIPAFSVIINTLFMFQLDTPTWIRLGIWLIVGLLIYFWYGNSNSTEEPKQD